MIFESLNRRDFDISINWDTLTICQYKCPYCYARAETQYWGKIQKNNEIDSIIDNIADCNYTFKICLLGGEPTLHPYLSALLKKLNSLLNVKHIEVFTNFKNEIKFNINSLEKVTVVFSYHLTENKDPSLFLERVKNIKNHKLFLMIPQSKKYAELAEKLYSELIKYKPMCHYITINNNTKTKFNFKNETEDKFFVNGINASISEILNNSQNYFKNWYCLRNDYTINVDGTVDNMCSYKVGNIFKDFKFKNISLNPVICDFEKCGNACWLETKKWK